MNSLIIVIPYVRFGGIFQISPTHILDRHSVSGLPLGETYLRTRSGVLTGVIAWFGWMASGKRTFCTEWNVLRRMIEATTREL
jgi:hypothetical protein